MGKDGSLFRALQDKFAEIDRLSRDGDALAQARLLGTLRGFAGFVASLAESEREQYEWRNIAINQMVSTLFNSIDTIIEIGTADMAKKSEESE